MVSVIDTYGGTNRMFSESFCRGLARKSYLCPTADQAAIEAAIDGGLRVLYLESPTNPTCKVLDLERLSARARARWSDRGGG